MIRSVRGLAIMVIALLAAACGGGSAPASSSIRIHGVYSIEQHGDSLMTDCANDNLSASGYEVTFRDEHHVIIATTYTGKNMFRKRPDPTVAGIENWTCIWSAPYAASVPRAKFYTLNSWGPISYQDLARLRFRYDLPHLTTP